MTDQLNQAIKTILDAEPVLQGIVDIRRSPKGYRAFAPWSRGTVVGESALDVAAQTFLPKGPRGAEMILPLVESLEIGDLLVLERRADGKIRITLQRGLFGLSRWPEDDDYDYGAALMGMRTTLDARDGR